MIGRPATIVIGLLAAAGLPACGETRAQGSSDTPKAPDAITVTVAPVAVRSVERTVSVVGTLAASEQADLASEGEGQVIAIEADLGDRVARDAVLARIRGDVIEARLREAEAGLDKAVADEARARPLRGQGIISEQEYQQVKTALAVARARRDELKIHLERLLIRSPFDGSVAERKTGLGDYVRGGTVMFRLVQDDPLKFRGEVPEREVPNVQVGQEIRVSVDPFPGEIFTGKIQRVGSASDAVARSLAFEAVVPNPDRRLRPGFFGHGELIVRRDERALAVPRAAITTFAGVTKLFVIENGQAHAHEVTLGVDLGDGWVEVTQGVGRGMQVATSGISRLAEGTAVTVRTDTPPGA